MFRLSTLQGLRRRMLTVAAGAPLVLTLSVGVATPATGCGAVYEGMHGACVLDVQERLAALHYDLGHPDGVFGSQTYHAVVAFQKVNRLSRTGVVNGATRARLFGHPIRPRLHFVKRGTALEVNLSKQVLLRSYKGRLVRIYDVSTGRPGLSTPATNGSPLHIWRKALWGTTGYNDSEHYVQYYDPGTLLAIHEYGYVPAYPASHGCIRVPPGSAGRLWARTFVGELVYTYY